MHSVTDRRTDRQTDGRTENRLMPIAEYCVAVRSAKNVPTYGVLMSKIKLFFTRTWCIRERLRDELLVKYSVIL